jgi:hypothetical protein
LLLLLLLLLLLRWLLVAAGEAVAAAGELNSGDAAMQDASLEAKAERLDALTGETKSSCA